VVRRSESGDIREANQALVEVLVSDPNTAALGCLAILVVALAIGLSVIVLGWLFGIGLRLAG